jgi:hypothetical protein
MCFSSGDGRSTIAKPPRWKCRELSVGDPAQWLRKTKKPRTVKWAAFFEKNQIT